ncbi:MAG: hypothetical protein F9K18_03930, partial [Thermoanaerobaculia bacterium]
MDLRTQLARRSRDARWVAAALALGLILATVVYALVQRGSRLPAALVTNRVLLFALWYANVVLILVILFVLARNLIKLWLERRTGALGARFKTKLVATYIGLSLVPVLALFFFASQLLRGAIDRWFSASLAEVLAQGDAVSHALQDTIETRNWRDAARLALELQGHDLADPSARAAAARRLGRGREETGADLVALFDGDDFVQAVLDPRSGIADLPELGRALP